MYSTSSPNSKAVDIRATIGTPGGTYVDDFSIAHLHMSFGWGRPGGYILMGGMKQ